MLSLVRILLGLKLGGNVDLLMTSFSDEVYLEALNLGQDFNLLEYREFEVAAGSVRSSTIRCEFLELSLIELSPYVLTLFTRSVIACQATGNISLQLCSLAPTLCFHQAASAIVMRQVSE